LGNNIVVNNNGAVVNPDFSKEEKEEIKNAFKVPVEIENIAGLKTVGSFASANSIGCLINHETHKPELFKIKKVLKTAMAPSTINMGNPYIKSGLVVNDYGFVIGSHSTGYEINEADIVFGFLNG